MIVVDSNIITARNLTSVLSSKAEQVEQKDPVWIVPVLWRYEFQNILATAIKAKQITPGDAIDVWQRVAGILVEAVKYLNEGNEIVVMKRKKPIARLTPI